MGKVGPTTRDLAVAAGVSLATVDRVLNLRVGVQEKTIARVTAAAEKIGFVRDISAANLSRSRNYSFLFVLPLVGDQFLGELVANIEEANKAFAGERVTVEAKKINVSDPHFVARFLSEIDPERYNGLAIMVPESPQVRDAVDHLGERGVKAVQFLSGQPLGKSIDFVGTDNYASGATAGSLMHRFLHTTSGKIVVISETMQSLSSIERRLGFDDVIARNFPNINVLPSLETYGDDGRAQKIIGNTFKNYSDIVGFYVVSSEARLPIEIVSQYAEAKNIIRIAHERTPFTELALKSGDLDAVIAQNPGHVVRSAVRILRARCDQREPLASQENIRIEILLRENL
jgi:LacI family transcriptional regulator